MKAAFRKLNALDELRQPMLQRELSAKLMAYGLPATDADTVAQNAALLYLALEQKNAPADAFELFSAYSLGEIAEFCEDYSDWCAGDFDVAVNTSYMEEIE